MPQQGGGAGGVVGGRACSSLAGGRGRAGGAVRACCAEEENRCMPVRCGPAFVSVVGAALRASYVLPPPPIIPPYTQMKEGAALRADASARRLLAWCVVATSSSAKTAERAMKREG